uniref:(northern house mosquito) hypothetical protein n=1 Tax=Culex pipiens TaxID=7175 RepID=A0A8D8IK09_CULPI
MNENILCSPPSPSFVSYLRTRRRDGRMMSRFHHLSPPSLFSSFFYCHSGMPGTCSFVNFRPAGKTTDDQFPPPHNHCNRAPPLNSKFWSQQALPENSKNDGRWGFWGNELYN